MEGRDGGGGSRMSEVGHLSAEEQQINGLVFFLSFV